MPHSGLDIIDFRCLLWLVTSTVTTPNSNCLPISGCASFRRIKIVQHYYHVETEGNADMWIDGWKIFFFDFTFQFPLYRSLQRRINRGNEFHLEEPEVKADMWINGWKNILFRFSISISLISDTATSNQRGKWVFPRGNRSTRRSAQKIVVYRSTNSIWKTSSIWKIVNWL